MLHEALLQLFRNRPALAPELLRGALQVGLPEYSEARIDSADLNQIQPTEYRADLVVLLLRGNAVLGIVVEVQLAPDERKDFVWPVYVTSLRARLRCPVHLLVVAYDEATARWARRPIDLGGANRFTPWVIGPSAVPHVTDPEQAREDPELAVLSALTHGRGPDVTRSAQIGYAAHVAAHDLDGERAGLYFDLVFQALSEGARRALQSMDPAKYEYQSDFAKHYIALGKTQGREEGRAEGAAQGVAQGVAQGRAALVAKQLTHRFGPLPEGMQARLASASVDELDAIGERLLTARTLEEAVFAAG